MAVRCCSGPSQRLAVEAEVVPVDAQEHGQVEAARHTVEFALL
jgi:hypothetical protein